MKHKKSFERILPLNPDLEAAALHALIAGKLNPKVIKKDELSKIGRSIYSAVQSLGGGPVKVRAVHASAVELHNADPSEAKAYLKTIGTSEMPQIQSVLQALARKRIINSVVNEASDQIASGDYSLLQLKALIDAHQHSHTKLVPLVDEMDDEAEPPKCIQIPSLPTVTAAVGGLYGVWLVCGEPAAGKSTLALQVACSVNRSRPVLYYDFEQGTGVIKWHIHKAFAGDKKQVKEATSRLYIRHSVATLESDLDSIAEPALVVVDSIQKVASSVTYRRESLDAWVHKLEALKKYGHHVIMVSEKRRGTYGDAALDSGKETGELEYAADTAFDIIKPDEEDSSHVELHITKNRHYKKTGFACELHRQNSWWFREGSSQRREVD